MGNLTGLIKKYLVKHEDWTAAQVAEVCGSTERYVQKVRGIMIKKGDISPKDDNLSQRKQMVSVEQEKKLRKENDELKKQIRQIKNELEVLEVIKNYDPKSFIIPIPKNNGKSEGTAVVQWSDWHVDEIVLAETINNANEYNKDIAKRRSIALAQNTIKIIKTQRNAIDIPHLILHLGGDWGTGYIHPEGEQTNWTSPINACFYAIDLLIPAIDYLLLNGEFETIKAICNRGNHGRTTKRMQSNDHEMNYENFIYYFLMKHYAKEKRIVFQISKSSYAYATVYGKRLRFFHGHQVKFKGGIGGLTIPLYKLIHRLNANTAAYYNFMCDKHTYSQPTPDCQCNGSMIGFNSYADDNGFKIQEPLQSFTLLDSKRGITIKAPIFCE